MKANARSRLKNVNYKLAVPLTLLNFLRRFNDGGRNIIVNKAEVAIGFSRRFLHHSESSYERGMCPHPGNRIILDGTSGLNSVINVDRNFLGAQRVLFSAGSERCTLTIRRHDSLLQNQKL